MDTQEVPQKEKQIANQLNMLENEIDRAGAYKDRMMVLVTPLMPTDPPSTEDTDTTKDGQSLVPLARQLRNYTEQLRAITDRYGDILNLNEL